MFIATPNRWFPVEHHTGVSLLHFLPAVIYRRVLQRTSLRYWADERHLHLLTRHELMRLFSEVGSITVKRVGIGPGLFRSNLVAYS